MSGGTWSDPLLISLIPGQQAGTSPSTALPLTEQEKTLKGNASQEPVHSVAQWTYEILLIATSPSMANWTIHNSTARAGKQRCFYWKRLAQMAAALWNSVQGKTKSACLSLVICFWSVRIFLLVSWEGRRRLAFQKCLAQQPRKDELFVPAQS